MHGKDRELNCVACIEGNNAEIGRLKRELAQAMKPGGLLTTSNTLFLRPGEDFLPLHPAEKVLVALESLGKVSAAVHEFARVAKALNKHKLPNPLWFKGVER